MSDRSATMTKGSQPDVRALLARAAGADAPARDALAASIDDAFLPAEGRLDDRTRAALSTLIDAMVQAVERELTEHAARLLGSRGEAATAERLLAERAPVADRLANAGLLRDADFAGECLARVRLELLGTAMPVDAVAEADAPSLLPRLAQSPDRVVATAAAAVMIADSARRLVGERGRVTATGLPAALHARLVWWVAAAVRERLAGDGGDMTAVDRALAEAALRNLAAHDEDDRLEGATMRLAAAIDARADELPALIEEVLRDRRLSMLAALLAHALGVRYELARELVIDPSGERLWLVLRALDLPRPVIARVGFHLCEADPRRDVEAFADTLDVIASVDAPTAAAAVAPLRLHPDYRAAQLALTLPAMRR